MVIECAKIAVERKLTFIETKPILISDYECAYACGIAAKKLNMEKETNLEKLFEKVKEQIKKLRAIDEILANLLEGYELKYTQAEEITMLIQMGYEI